MVESTVDFSVIIPAYNEELVIGPVIKRLVTHLDNLNRTYEVLVVSDGSTDETNRVVKGFESPVRLIELPYNIGNGAAIKTGIRRAQGEIIICMDADGQHKISDIKRVIIPIENKQSDIVIGSRFLTESNSVPQYRKLGINIITKVTNSSLSEKLTDSQSGFRAYSKDILKKIIPTDTGMGVSTEILIKSSNAGFKISEVPIDVSYEGDTSTHNPVSHGADVLLSTIKYTAMERPLRFYGIPAMIFFIIGLSFASLSFQYYADVGRLSTNLTLVAGGTILIGVILAVTSVLLFSLTSIVKEKTR